MASYGGCPPPPPRPSGEERGSSSSGEYIPRPPTPPEYRSQSKRSSEEDEIPPPPPPDDDNQRQQQISQSTSNSGPWWSNAAQVAQSANSDFSNRMHAGFPQAGQVRSDGKAVKDSSWGESSKINDDGVQYRQEWAFQMSGESGRTSAANEWFVGSTKDKDEEKGSKKND